MNSITIVIDKKNSFNSNNNNIYKKKKINKFILNSKNKKKIDNDFPKIPLLRRYTQK